MSLDPSAGNILSATVEPIDASCKETSWGLSLAGTK